MLRAILEDKTYAKHNVLLVIVKMVYTKSILNEDVDWSSLPSRLRSSYLVRKPQQILLQSLPQWFNNYPHLLSKPNLNCGVEDVDYKSDHEMIDGGFADHIVSNFDMLPEGMANMINAEIEDHSQDTQSIAIEIKATNMEVEDVVMELLEVMTNPTLIAVEVGSVNRNESELVYIEPSSLDSVHHLNANHAGIIGKQEVEIETLRAKMAFLES